MKLTDVLDEDTVTMELRARTREGAIGELVELLAAKGHIDPGDAGPLKEAVLRREHLSSTAVGQGVAIPHAKAATAKRLVAAFGRSTEGIAFGARDGEPVHLVFLLASLPDSQRAHLRALAHIARLVRKDDLRERMLAAKDPAEVLGIIAEGEE